MVDNQVFQVGRVGSGMIDSVIGVVLAVNCAAVRDNLMAVPSRTEKTIYCLSTEVVQQ